VRAALRLGAYQLGFIDGVPRYAAVNESVELVRAAGLERAVAFTNAVLRRLADGIRPLLEALPEASAKEAALKHSYPDWVAERWWRDLGAEDAVSLCAPRTSPRNRRTPRSRRDRRDARSLDPGAWHVDRVDSARRGRVWPQSSASQLVGLTVAARNGERVLDLCAAPGGKATMLSGDVVAVELNGDRARELRDTVSRLGVDNVRVVVADGRQLPAELSGFDRTLVDAPCSGLGVLNQRPDLRWRSEPLPDLQLDLLRAAAERTRPGGAIVYSVCTINADESEAVVDASGLEVDPTLADEWPQFRHPRRPEFLQTLPHVHGTAGFFVARLLRE
jgi:16S rRNA (cytosine967-C5)-methyltransferase